MDQKEMTLTEIAMRKVNSFTDEELHDFWYDWFCNDNSLKGKAKYLLGKLKKVIKANNGTKFDPANCYVFFKNNCPMVGNLFDDFRICSIETGKVLYTIAPRRQRKKHDVVCDLWGVDNGFAEPIITTNDFNNILKYFEEPIIETKKEA